ncbi:MAG: glycosyltransferase family 2 protein [Pseudorhodobacter sp.]
MVATSRKWENSATAGNVVTAFGAARAERPTYFLPTPSARKLGLSLLQEGLIGSDTLLAVLAIQKRHGGRIADILLARNSIAEMDLYAAMARHWSLRLIDPEEYAPDPALLDRLGAEFCLREGILPLRSNGKVTIVATARPEEFARHHSRLQSCFGPVMAALAPPRRISTAILKARGTALGHAAEKRVAAPESCRDWDKRKIGTRMALCASAVCLAFWIIPGFTAGAFVGWTIFSLALVMLLRVLAVFAMLRRRPKEPPKPVIARLPVVSIMVALFKEDDIASRLVHRLDQIDYPRDLLDVLLVVEEKDNRTRAALARSDLPPWIRVIAVPDGTLKTKPRALNFALGLCRGSIIGVYDAEDAPDPAQIRKVVDRFHSRGHDLACLQGVLDYYNPGTNWLSRCFTFEYATWFRIILPGMERLCLAIPLGGTTLFFRRSVLEELGAWDAHNVTEDADLGIRLARHGYRTELIDTVTEEEANCRVLPWIRQRSRWLKGYMITWAVHMRDPALLWRQLGPWRFLGFQVVFLCSLSQFLLAPVLWSFWLIPLGVSHPVTESLPDTFGFALITLFLVAEAVNIGINIVALRMTAHRISPLWAFSMHLYFPLGTIAAYKAAWELLRKPFYWDKTSHGHFDAT